MSYQMVDMYHDAFEMGLSVPPVPEVHRGLYCTLIFWFLAVLLSLRALVGAIRNQAYEVAMATAGILSFLSSATWIYTVEVIKPRLLWFWSVIHVEARYDVGFFLTFIAGAILLSADYLCRRYPRS